MIGPAGCMLTYSGKSHSRQEGSRKASLVSNFQVFVHHHMSKLMYFPHIFHPLRTRNMHNVTLMDLLIDGRSRVHAKASNKHMDRSFGIHEMFKALTFDLALEQIDPSNSILEC